MKKKTLNYVATFVAGVGLALWVQSAHTDSAQDAAEYAAKTCKVAPR